MLGLSLRKLSTRRQRLECVLIFPSITQSEWTAEFEFRATGPERGGGNLQVWYAKDGKDKIGTSSIYTVNQFDGFALVIDSHGGRVCVWPVCMEPSMAKLSHREAVLEDFSTTARRTTRATGAWTA